MSSERIRVLCVDDHAIVREGISVMIALQNDMEVVATAASGEEAVRVFRRCAPDVTLMDLQLPGMSGLEAIREIRREAPESRIIIFTMYEGDEDIFRGLEAGAVTYVLKDTPSDELVQIIRQVHSGDRPVLPDIETRLAQRKGQPTLTPREIQVTELIARGMRNKEIAASLGISEETVPVHVKNILAKLRVNDRTAVVSVAARRGIIHL